MVAPRAAAYTQDRHQRRLRRRASRSFGGWAWPLACLLALAFASSPTNAFAAEEHCPNSGRGTAVVDWGANGHEELGAGFLTEPDEDTPEPVLGFSELSKEGLGIQQVKAGFDFGVALLDNCTLRSWGRNLRGNLGDGEKGDETHPVEVTYLSNQKRVPLTEVKEIAVASSHAMALLYNGTVWTWGGSELGERGNRERGLEKTAKELEPEQAKPRDEPTEVETWNGKTFTPLTGVEQIVAGGARDYALLASGEVMAWGQDANGQLGVDESTEEEQKEQCSGATGTGQVLCSTFARPVRTAVGETGSALTGVERIGAGEESAYAVRDSRKEVVSWGNDDAGELGDDNTEDSSSPVRVQFPSEPASPIAEVAGGARQVLARLADGEVYAWGGDKAGALGFEASELCKSAACSKVPVLVAALQHVVAVATGEANSIALKEEASGADVIYSFGAGGFAHLLGLGFVPFESTFKPEKIEGLASVTGVSSSSDLATAVLEEGAGLVPGLTATAKNQALAVTWRLPVQVREYAVTYNPVGGKPVTASEGGCASGCSGGETIANLNPEPYEVTVGAWEGKTNPQGKRKDTERVITATPLPAEGAPVSSSLPSIEGSPATKERIIREGQTLTVSPGSWTTGSSKKSETPKFTYEWLRCDGDGEGASAEGVSTGLEEEEEEPEGFGANCKTIDEATDVPATKQSYTPVEADLGQTLRVKVRAENAVGFSVAASEAELVLGAGEEEAPEAPTNSAAPTVVGKEGATLKVAKEGERLEVGQAGKWEADGKPLAAGTNTEGGKLVQGRFSYKWLRCKRAEEIGGEKRGAGCRAIKIGAEAFAEGTAYSLSEDQGKWIEVQERATDGGGSRVAFSRPIEVEAELPVNTRLPTISLAGGVEFAIAPEEGQTLEAHEGAWTNNPEGRPSLQWLRCNDEKVCAAIEKATHATHELTAADVGDTIEVEETVENAAGAPHAVSTATEAVLKTSLEPPALETGKLPKITGRAEVGQTLKVQQEGVWKNHPKEFEYQWRKCEVKRCVPVTNGGHESYLLTKEDEGDPVEVKVTAVNAAGPSEPVVAGPTEAVTAAVLANVSPPTIAGKAQEGKLLTASAGSWSVEPTTDEYEWLRCKAAKCAEVKYETGEKAGEKVTGSTYLPQAGDVGSAIEVKVTAKDEEGATAAATSAATVEVLIGEPINTALPTMTGSATEGETLLAHAGSWSPEAKTFEYEWLRCAGSECEVIVARSSEATTYKLEKKDVGDTISVRVTAENAGGFGRATSAATQSVTRASKCRRKGSHKCRR